MHASMLLPYLVLWATLMNALFVKAKWLPPNGFTCKVHHLDAKVGGT